MLHTFAIIRGTFVTVHHNDKTDRVGIILAVKTNDALLVDRAGKQPTEEQYFASTKQLLNTIPGNAWQADRPVILTVLQNADGVPIDVCSILFDKADNPMTFL